MYKIYIITLLFCLSPLRAQESIPPEILRAEIEELQTVISSLRSENRMLKSQNEQLVNDVLQLGHRIQALQKQENVPPPPQHHPQRETSPASISIPQPLVEPDVEETPPEQVITGGQYNVLYVNPNWHYLIVNAGSKSGIHVGDIGSVIRNQTIIARVKVSDTKDNQLTADIDLQSMAERGIYPRKDDQVRFQ
ncbi:hypothetical protein P3T73_10820 [Kiritimatiellota bacterium B12222]|nr:hypothetical protein P3T73_10820 [Kiritimatiellota bacterium B12222]